jgi:hypothetical protein
LEAFQRLGAGPWTERARNQLRATGMTMGVSTGASAGEVAAHVPIFPAVVAGADREAAVRGDEPHAG